MFQARCYRMGRAGGEREEVAWGSVPPVPSRNGGYSSLISDVGKDAVAPAVESHDQVEDPLRVAAGIARMTAAISVSTVIRPAPPVIRHAWFLPKFPAPGEDRHDQVLRQREQPPTRRWRG